MTEKDKAEIEARGLLAGAYFAGKQSLRLLDESKRMALREADYLSQASKLMAKYGIQELNTGEGYIYRLAKSKKTREFKPDAIKHFSPTVIAEYFTGDPKITKKGFNRAVKDGILPKSLYNEITEEFPGGEISLKKVVDKEYLEDVRV